MKNNISILMIVPCFNEALRLKTDEFHLFSKNNPDVHFLFVDDGSTDTTKEVLTKLCEDNPNFTKLILEQNQGKAEAVRRAVNASTERFSSYDFVGYIDADLSIPLNEIDNFIEAISKNDAIKFVLGIRVIRLGAIIEQKKLRYYLSRIFANMAGVLLKEAVFDTQCGAKLIHASVAPQLFKDAFISKWLFDIELLARFKILYGNTPNHEVLEQPLDECRNVQGSKIKKRHFLNVPNDFLKIWSKYRKAIKNAGSLIKQ